jgi:hypothetical protein
VCSAGLHILDMRCVCLERMLSDAERLSLDTQHFLCVPVIEDRRAAEKVGYFGAISSGVVEAGPGGAAAPPPPPPPRPPHATPHHKKRTDCHH